jgi:hypothetical protein
MEGFTKYAAKIAKACYTGCGKLDSFFLQTAQFKKGS